MCAGFYLYSCMSRDREGSVGCLTGRVRKLKSLWPALIVELPLHHLMKDISSVIWFVQVSIGRRYNEKHEQVYE